MQGSHDPRWNYWQGPGGFGQNPGKMSEEAVLPLAARISILDEVGTVFVDRIVSQVHTDLILGKET